jgi:heat shock protein HslJ
MACPDMTVETDFLKAISGRSLTYRREDGLLVLSGEDDTELKFKKVD